jgi:hypothetical protein
MQPRLQAFLLADAVYQDHETGKHVIAGTFARLVVPHMPGELDRTVSAYCAFAGVLGNAEVAMQFETETGEILTRSNALMLTCSDPRLLVEFALPVPSLPVPSAGWYRMVLMLNGQRLATLMLELVLTP